MKNSFENTGKNIHEKAAGKESGEKAGKGPVFTGEGSGAGQRAGAGTEPAQKPGPKMSPKELLLLGAMAAVYIAIHFLYPPQSRAVYSISLSYLQEMALIIPPVFILMGIFEVWVPKTFIQKYMGKEAGIRGAGLAFVLGTIPTGPVYIAFPIAAAMVNKGARVMNITIFLGTWAAAKLPQLMVELKFLGPSFTALRFLLTLFSVVAIGFLVEKLLTRKKEAVL